MKVEVGDRQYVNNKPATVTGVVRDENNIVIQVFLHMDEAGMWEGQVGTRDIDTLDQRVLPF